MSVATDDMTSGLRKSAIELAGVVLRFVLFLLIMKFVFLDWFRYLFSPETNLAREQEIVRPFHDFLGPPRTIARPTVSPMPGDPWGLRPGEHLVETPDAPEGAWPMVEGLDGRLYQLGPGGMRHPVADRALMDWAAKHDGFDSELLRQDADGKREMVKLGRYR